MVVRALGLSLLIALSLPLACSVSTTAAESKEHEVVSSDARDAPSPDTRAKAPKPAHSRPERSLSTLTLDHDGRSRRALVYVPRALRGTAELAPLVLAFHGGGANAEGTRRAYGLEAVAETEGFVVAYPEGTGKRVLGRLYAVWAVGPFLDRPELGGVDDLAFVDALLERLEAEFKIDRRRIYATGLSNGSHMALTLACERSERIAAVVGTGGPLEGTRCTPTRAVPTLYVAGRRDPCSPLDGGSCGGCWAQALGEVGLREGPVEKDQCAPVDEFIQGWSAMLGCTANEPSLGRADRVDCRSYEDCRDGAELRYCIVDDLGHVWPGGNYGACEFAPESKFCAAFIRAVGPKSDALDLASEGWAFMGRFSLPK